MTLIFSFVGLSRRRQCLNTSWTIVFIFVFHVCVVDLFDYSDLYIAIWRALSEINEEAIPLVYACIPDATHNVTRPDFLLMFYLEDFLCPKIPKRLELTVTVPFWKWYLDVVWCRFNHICNCVHKQCNIHIFTILNKSDSHHDAHGKWLKFWLQTAAEWTRMKTYIHINCSVFQPKKNNIHTIIKNTFAEIWTLTTLGSFQWSLQLVTRTFALWVNRLILLIVGDASSLQTLQNLQSLAALASVAGNTGISKGVLTKVPSKENLSRLYRFWFLKKVVLGLSHLHFLIRV